MTDNTTDDADGQNSKLSRRTALALMGTSAVGGAAATGAFSKLTADRPITVGVTDSSTADFDVAVNGSALDLYNNTSSSYDILIDPNDADVYRSTYTGSVSAVSGKNPVTVTLPGGSSETIAFERSSGSASVSFDITGYAGTSGLDINTTRNVSVDAIPSNAVSRWTLDTTDSSTATDIWGSNDASFQGDSVQGSGANDSYATDNAVKFDGTGDYALLSNPSLPNGSDARSIALWHYVSGSTSQFFGFLSWGEEGTDNSLFELRDSAGVYQFTGWFNDESLSESVPTDTWQFVVLTYDGDQELTLYLGGGTSAAQTNDGNIDQLDTINTEMRLGMSVDTSTEQMTGRIDDVRVYDKELTGTEVDNLYTTGSING